MPCSAVNAELGMGRVHPRVGSCWVRMCDRHANDRQLQILSSSLSFICYWIPSHVKVYVEIVNAVDAYKLHTTLDLIAAWAATWHFVNKCNILHIGSVQCRLIIVQIVFYGVLSVKTLACLYARFSCMFDQSLSIVLWYGRHVQNRIIETIEKVQRRFTKRLKSLKCMFYIKNVYAALIYIV